MRMTVREMLSIPSALIFLGNTSLGVKTIFCLKLGPLRNDTSTQICTPPSKICRLSFVSILEKLPYLSQPIFRPSIHMVSIYHVKFSFETILRVTPNWPRRSSAWSIDRDCISLRSTTFFFIRRRWCILFSSLVRTTKVPAPPSSRHLKLEFSIAKMLDSLALRKDVAFILNVTYFKDIKPKVNFMVTYWLLPVKWKKLSDEDLSESEMFIYTVDIMVKTFHIRKVRLN